jgi:hypothetical protein
MTMRKFPCRIEGRSRRERDVDLDVRHLVRPYCYLAHQLSTKYRQQFTEGYVHDGRLIGRGTRDKELDGNRDTRHRN